MNVQEKIRQQVETSHRALHEGQRQSPQCGFSGAVDAAACGAEFAVDAADPRSRRDQVVRQLADHPAALY